MQKLLRLAFSRRPKTSKRLSSEAKKSRNRFVPQVEALEDRRMLSGSGLQLRLEEAGFAALTVVDGGPGDINPLPGVIVFTGSYGTFDLNVSAVLSKPQTGDPNTSSIDCSDSNASSTVGGVLNITWADTDYATPPFASNPGTFTSEIGG